MIYKRFLSLVLMVSMLCLLTMVSCVAVEVPAAGAGAETEQLTSETFSYDGVYPQHEPYGTGIGAVPGRVVWAHDPDCVEWDGSGYWWETDHFDEAAIQSMVDKCIASLGGRSL